MKIYFSGKSIIGNVREKNEDRFYINKEMNIVSIADGMGGHKGGEYASDFLIKNIETLVTKDEDITEEYEKLDIPVKIRKFLKLIKKVNINIYTEAQKLNLLNMGTTLVSVIFEKNDAYFINVGDSRGYILRNNLFKQITQDHSLIKELKKDYPNNIITRAIGPYKNVEPDIFKVQLQNNDIILLCSDGLVNDLNDDEIKNILLDNKNNDLEKIIDILITEVENRSARDNITVILSKINESTENIKKLSDKIIIKKILLKKLSFFEKIQKMFKKI